jgi:hypothetical protein
MQLLAPDIIAELRGLSIPICALGVFLGLALWLTGWWGHRFWIVLILTVTAGVFGLLSVPANRMQPLVAGLLLALAAGALALALVRMVAFGAGGFAAWIAVHSLAPPAWDEPFLTFLAGGLAALLLYRIWIMALTSFAGTVLMAYFGLCLAGQLGKLDPITLTDGRALLWNIACGGTTLIGLVTQFILDRRRIRYERRRLELRYGYTRWGRYADGRRWWWSNGRRDYRQAG